jgi:hypothetical protein
MLDTSHLAYRNGLIRIDSMTRTKRGARYGSHLAMGAFIAALWLFDFAMQALKF